MIEEENSHEEIISNQEKGQLTEVYTLNLIGRFKWLRMQEIALLNWYYEPDRNSYQYARNLVNRLLKKDLVFIQKLPEHAGTAVVLKEKGAKIVRANGFDVKRTQLQRDKCGNEHWVPPRTWKHDLLSVGFAIESMYQMEFDQNCKWPPFLTETELRKIGASSNRKLFEHLDIPKIPDLLIKTSGGYLAIEVERARKFGEKNKKSLITNLVHTNKIGGIAMHNFNGINPERVAFAFDPAEKEGNKKINHEKNIITSTLALMKKQGVNKLEIEMYKLKVKNFGVIGYKKEKIMLEHPLR